MEKKIISLIAETDRARTQLAGAGHKIDAAACAIRMKALEEALKIVLEGK